MHSRFNLVAKPLTARAIVCFFVTTFHNFWKPFPTILLLHDINGFARTINEIKLMCSGKTKVFWLTSKIKVTMLYKIRNDLIRISKKDLVPATSLRYRLNYAVPHSKLERHLHSFFPSSIRLWNRLPSEIKLSPDLLKFKSAVQNFQLTQPSSNHDFVFY